MVINVQSEGERSVLRLDGRFDANWADHVGQAMESAIRAGQHELELDFAKVSYISSAGLRVLLKYFKQLKAIGGSLHLTGAADSVFEVLRLSGLAALLMPTAAPAAAAAPAPPSSETASPRRWTQAGVELESYPLSAAAPMTGRLWGAPDAFAKGRLTAAQAESLRCTPDLLVVGLGAFGQRSEEAASRFGESLAVAGIAVTQPTDGSSLPDYQVTEGELVPELQLLYGVGACGQFSHLIRFEAVRSERGVLSLDALVQAALDELQSPAAAFTLIAESASVVGAMLKRSPALAGGAAPLSFPAVRDWLTFTTERTDERNLVLIAGMAMRQPPPEMAAYLRRLGRGTDVHGHFHAAMFAYRPVAKGKLELGEAVASLLSTDSVQAIMHLLADEREFEGVGQTDLMRGACWAAALRLETPAREVSKP